MIWLTNYALPILRKDEKWAAALIIGAPEATDKYSIVDLKEKGIVGLYRPGDTNKPEDS